MFATFDSWLAAEGLLNATTTESPTPVPTSDDIVEHRFEYGWASSSLNASLFLARGRAYDADGARIAGVTYFNGCALGGACKAAGCDGVGFGDQASFLNGSGAHAAYGAAWVDTIGGCAFQWGRANAGDDDDDLAADSDAPTAAPGETAAPTANASAHRRLQETPALANGTNGTNKTTSASTGAPTGAPTPFPTPLPTLTPTPAPTALWPTAPFTFW